MFPWLITLGGVRFDTKRKEAWDQKKVSFKPPEKPIRVRVARINQRIGRRLDEIRQRDLHEMRGRMNTSAIKSTLSKTIITYRTSKLIANSPNSSVIISTAQIARKLLLSEGITWVLLNAKPSKPSKPWKPLKPSRRTQQRRIIPKLRRDWGFKFNVRLCCQLEEVWKPSTLQIPPVPIILQDPEYTEDDKEAAESFEDHC